jgi:hypothetical protein
LRSAPQAQILQPCAIGKILFRFDRPAPLNAAARRDLNFASLSEFSALTALSWVGSCFGATTAGNARSFGRSRRHAGS